MTDLDTLEALLEQARVPPLDDMDRIRGRAAAAAKLLAAHLDAHGDTLPALLRVARAAEAAVKCGELEHDHRECPRHRRFMREALDTLRSGK